MTTFFFFFGDRLKNFCEDVFFGEHLRLCPWSLALASSIPVLGLESVCPRKGYPWPWIFFVSLALVSSLVSSTPPLINRPMRLQLIICYKKELLLSFSSVKLELIRNKCYQCKLVCIGTMNEWCKILTIKTLTEVSRA